MPKILRLAEVLRFIFNHPLNRQHKLRALGRFLRWQVGSRLAPGPVIIPFVEGTRLIARPGLMGATGIYYTGLYEFEEMAFTLHALRPGDRFIDVGAHIGAFSLLAAGVVGADSLAIEPVPASFTYLQDNLNLNALGGKVRALNVGIAAQAGQLQFTTGKGAANGVVPGGAQTLGAQALRPSVEVEVQPLDALAGDFAPTLLKIDVEGYEREVIAGASKTLADERLMAILIELRGHGARYGFDENVIHQRLLDLGFQPYTYFLSPPFRGELEGGKRETPNSAGELEAGQREPPGSRQLIPLPGINLAAGTTLYIRDLALVQERIATAPRFRVHGQEI
jgi:FkbM family methyltransferase